MSRAFASLQLLASASLYLHAPRWRKCGCRSQRSSSMPSTGREMMSGTILVVDDNEANLHLIAAVLKTRGYQSIEATSGESALAAVEARQPALVLMDVQMPDMSGIDVARAVREM